MPAQYNILKWHQYFVEIQVNAFQLSKICYADLSWIHVLKWNEVSKYVSRYLQINREFSEGQRVIYLLATRVPWVNKC